MSRILLSMMSSYLSLFYSSLLALFSFHSFSQNMDTLPIVVDAHYRFEEAIRGTKAPQEIIQNLALVDVEYYGFDHALHRGQLIVNKQLTADVVAIFVEIKAKRFPLKSVIPIVKYAWDDSASMLANNTSSFNFRAITGSQKLSKHATGNAIDFNPLLNPYIKGNVVLPQGAVYDRNAQGTIHPQLFLYRLFIQRGWTWGGDWHSLKDYQHFEK